MISNEVFINSLKFSSAIAAMASEENEEIIVVEDAKHGKYIIAFDPLDGSSNIDANVSIGTIFGIWRRDDVTAEISPDEFLKPGHTIVAAGYALYGSSC